eukprot:6199294-Pleurochrysis_carterae.AAC.1
MGADQRLTYQHRTCKCGDQESDLQSSAALRSSHQPSATDMACRQPSCAFGFAAAASSRTALLKPLNHHGHPPDLPAGTLDARTR